MDQNKGRRRIRERKIERGREGVGDDKDPGSGHRRVVEAFG